MGQSLHSSTPMMRRGEHRGGVAAAGSLEVMQGMRVPSDRSAFTVYHYRRGTVKAKVALPLLALLALLADASHILIAKRLICVCWVGNDHVLKRGQHLGHTAFKLGALVW